MANMTFGTNLIPSSDNTYSLGNSNKKWKIYGNEATTSEAGLLSASDKTKLDGIASGAQAGTVTSVTLIAGTGISLDTNNTAITTSGSRTITNSGVRSITSGSTDGTISVNTNGTSTEISVYGLKSAAYTEASAYAIAAHTHGNLTTDGKIGSTSGYAVYTTTSGALTAGSLETSDPTASGQNTSFIATVSQDGKGKITATKASIASGTTSTAGVVQLTDSTSSTSTTTAATPNSVKSAYDLANAAMPKSGGTFTGAITLAANPSANLQAATKQYVDNNVSIADTLGSGTQIGTITINGTSTTIYAPSSAPATIAVTQSASTPTLQFIVGTHNSSTASLTGVLSTTTTIANGKIIYYLTPYALPDTQVTLTLAYANSGTNTGAIPIYSYGNTRSLIPYPANSILILVYYNSAFYLVNNTFATVGGTVAGNNYNSGDQEAY